MAKKLTPEERINQMFDANLASQKETLTQDYQKADADYVRQQEKTQKAADANLTRTAVEAQKEAVNNAEMNNASGLSSGARAQLRLSNQNQMRSDMTALRAQQQEIDAEIERSRSLLSQEYASAIRKAQQDNDLARAEALYAEAEKQDEVLRQQQENEAAEKKQNDLAAAQLMAQTGDYTLIGKYYGLSDAEIAKLNSVAAGAQQTQGTTQQDQGATDTPPIPGFSGAADNGNLSDSQIKSMQTYLGIDVDGRWGPQSRSASQARYGTTDPVAAFQMYRKDYYNGLIESANSAKRTYGQLDYASQRAVFNEAVAAFNDAYNNGIITAEQRDSLIGIVTPIGR